MANTDQIIDNVQNIISAINPSDCQFDTFFEMLYEGNYKYKIFSLTIYLKNIIQSLSNSLFSSNISFLGLKLNLFGLFLIFFIVIIIIFYRTNIKKSLDNFGKSWEAEMESSN